MRGKTKYCAWVVADFAERLVRTRGAKTAD